MMVSDREEDSILHQAEAQERVRAQVSQRP